MVILGIVIFCLPNIQLIFMVILGIVCPIRFATLKYMGLSQNEVSFFPLKVTCVESKKDISF